MKIRCVRSALQEAIQTVGAIASQRSIKEVLQFIRLRADDGALILEATDFDTSIRFRISQVTIEEGGTVVVPASRMVALFRDVAGDEASIASDQAGLRVTMGGGRFRVPIRPADDFPELPAIEGGVKFRVPRDLFGDLVRKVSIATADERTRYAFDAVKWIVGDGALKMAATDGKRMSYMGAPVETTGSDTKEVMVQARGLQHFVRSFGPGEESAEILLDDFQAGLRTDRVEVFVRLTEGKFPDFQTLLDKRLAQEVTLDRAGFERSVRAAAVFAGSDAPTVILTFKPGEVVFSSGTSEAGDAELSLPSDYSGEERELGFNPYFLLDLTKVVEEDSLRLEFEDTNTAARFRVGENFTHIVMPISREYAQV
jgi:DNA polymerase-3 subunit beta